MKRPADAPKFERETDLCAAFIAAVDARKWTCYSETEGWDILAVRQSDGVQIGIEAKLRLNPEVVSQALPETKHGAVELGPDYRAVLVPSGGVQNHLHRICAALGVTVITFRGSETVRHSRAFEPGLPDENRQPTWEWHQWAPMRRHKLPDYVPDVAAGSSAPVALTHWKIQAIRLVIVLEERPVTRADFKALGLSPSRWTDPYTGWLKLTPDGYVKGDGLPDFAGQHPRNYAEIKADRARWIWPQGAKPAHQLNLLEARS